MFAVFWSIERWQRTRGRADSVSQLLAVAGEPAAFWSVEYVYFSGGDGDGRREGRISLRQARDGALLARVDVHHELMVHGVDGDGNFVCCDPQSSLHVRDPRTLLIIRDTASIEASTPDFADRFAPASELRPEFSEGSLTVLDRLGGRVSLRAALGLVTAVPGHTHGSFARQSSGWAIEGHPRGQLRLAGRPVPGADFLEGEVLGIGWEGDAIVLSRVDLRSKDSEFHRVTRNGEVLFSVPLGRPARGEIGRIERCGDYLVVQLNAADPRPMELVAINFVKGELAWRLRP
jgi:hypothetical protein